jgi:cobalt/nickel transport protein
MIIPERDTIKSSKNLNMNLKYIFMHPFEQTYMNMQKPEEAGVIYKGRKITFTNKLKSFEINGYKAWETNYKIKRPGDYIFYLIPKPYFEPAEEKFIKHITKFTVNSFYLSDGWDKPTGLKTEIVPLSRPYAIWKNNIFRAIVLKNGKPVPNVEVEVEVYNDVNLKIPNDNFITQIIKTDKNGIFEYSFPFSGLWGFSALMEDDKKIEKNGKKYPVELGAVYWLKVYDYK